MAHCVHSDRRECDAMRRAGVVVAHCAGSNINLCSGVSPVREMLQQGIWVTLGSDIAGGACLPMYKVATMSIRASKIKRIETDWSEDFLTVPEAYYLATVISGTGTASPQAIGSTPSWWMTVTSRRPAIP